MPITTEKSLQALKHQPLAKVLSLLWQTDLNRVYFRKVKFVYLYIFVFVYIYCHYYINNNNLVCSICDNGYSVWYDNQSVYFASKLPHVQGVAAITIHWQQGI